MTALLDIVKADSDSKSGWSGQIVLPHGPRPPLAQPEVIARNDHAAIVMGMGALCIVWIATGEPLS